MGRVVRWIVPPLPLTAWAALQQPPCPGVNAECCSFTVPLLLFPFPAHPSLVVADAARVF